MNDAAPRDLDLELSQRIEAMEQYQARLLDLIEALGAAQEERLDRRIEAMEKRQIRLQGQLEAMSAAQQERFDALEALLVEQLRAARKTRGDVRDCDAAQLNLAQRLEAQEGLLMELDLGVRAALDRISLRDLEQHDQLAALEDSLSDQRHAMQRLVATFDNSAHGQRLEFQRRLTNLNNSLMDQRQELASQLAGIEAGLSDLRVSLSRLGAGGPAGPASQGEAADAGQAAAGGELERKLGIVIDCMLADHVAAQARQGVDAGGLEEAAYRELVRGLEELKLERLRARYPSPGGQPAGGHEDEGEA